MTSAELLDLADHARKHAHAPYSRYAVGAALLGRSGRVYLGCNVENASFGLSICAERTAVFKAVSEGECDFVAVAVVTPDEGATPCGACRQVLHEFSPDLVVYWRGRGGRIVKRRLRALLADGFSFPERTTKRSGRTRARTGGHR